MKYVILLCILVIVGLCVMRVEVVNEYKRNDGQMAYRSGVIWVIPDGITRCEKVKP